MRPNGGQHNEVTAEGLKGRKPTDRPRCRRKDTDDKGTGYEGAYWIPLA
jgi:hypothetical protein